MVTLLVAICFISFLLIKNSPIDPIQAYIGADMLKVGPEQREKIAEYWGLKSTNHGAVFELGFCIAYRGYGDFNDFPPSGLRNYK